jgi:hypothetical protein
MKKQNIIGLKNILNLAMIPIGGAPNQDELAD